MDEYAIDFVIAWVDGSDPEWQKEKAIYTKTNNLKVESDSRDLRYKDLGTLRYWFRGVEKFAPWVRKIHFVTWGHIPAWLDLQNKKLNVVKHDEFIPKEYLPTFSSHAIELNMHRIKGLAEHFVYFNDDMFLISPCQKNIFFHKGMPCDIAAINARWFIAGQTPAFVQLVDTSIINKYFNKNNVIRKNFFKWFNLKYGELMFRTLTLMPWPHFIALHTRHLPTSFLKSTFEEVWEKEEAILDSTCRHKIRSYLDVNQWLMEFWQICSGKFHPAWYGYGYGYVVKDSELQTHKISKEIERQKVKMLCIGEDDNCCEIDRIMNEIIASFDRILPEKSSFEK